jgi:GMP synthase (glutamine-hydrolysing)
LDSEKKATSIVEENFAKHKPSQYFAATLDNKTVSHARTMHLQESAARLLNAPLKNVSIKVFQAKATGVESGRRLYGEIAAIKAQAANGSLHNPPIPRLVSLQAKIVAENPSFTRIFYAIKETPQKQPYVIALRAIQTSDFLTAKVTEIPWATLNETASRILEACRNVSAVYYDVTTKPPATVEME